MNPADQIVLRLALMDPMRRVYDESSDMICRLCDGDDGWHDAGPIHASDCLWVEACQYTGTDLGAHGVAE